ncbi:MepB family protein [Leptospira harrisiae]|uniref:MepB protein n=1 Tax=Leptospira harrisiae TaxID=2023189 RepID=A0A2N0AID7_9LEPT|nr:MepB family protein [Leptospira harrisiae]PJZ84040.1 MepB protein [Leptospira harrisiae]PKA08044.1 MepB protein [Leptospira harrisiae]
MKQSSSLENTSQPFLNNIQRCLFDPLKLIIQDVSLEKESGEYNACHFRCKKILFSFRKAKVTPKKIGQFVTLWKRSVKGPIEPYRFNDKMDIYIIETSYKNRIGHFLFTKDILNEHGILLGKFEGKRGFRVYPSWDKPNNKQGTATQKWQLPFFIESTDDKVNLAALKIQLEVFIK